MENLLHVEASDPTLTRLKKAKNELIGNRYMKKLHFASGILQDCVAILESTISLIEAQIQALGIINSYIEDFAPAQAFLKESQTLFPSVARILKDHAEEFRVQDMCLRVIRSALLKGIVSVYEFLQSDLLELFPNMMRSEVLVLIIAQIVEVCATTSFNRRKIFEQRDVILLFTEFIEQQLSFECEFAVLSALAKVTTEYEELCKDIMAKPGIYEVFERYIRHPSDQARLSIAQLQFVRFPPSQQHLLRWILPTLIKSVKSSQLETKVQAASVLATVLEANGSFQKTAGDLGGIEVLCDTLRSLGVDRLRSEDTKKPITKSTPIPAEPMGDIIDIEDPLVFSDHELSPDHKLIYHGLCALASIAACSEEFRKRIIEQNHYKLVLEFLKHSEPKIRSASCICLTSLARAEKSTKSALISEGVTTTLCKLLSDKYLEVQQNATSALCNVALEFQKRICEDADCIKRLVELAQSKHNTLRYKAVFAIKNLVFQTTPDVKKTVINKLTYGRLFELLEDEEPMVQEQVVCTIRIIIHKSKEFIQEVLDNCGSEALLRRIEGKLASLNPNLVAQTVYLLCNIASGTEKHKGVVMDNSIVKQVVSLLGHKQKQVKMAAVNFILNVLWKEGADSSGREKRKKALKELDVETKLNEISKSSEDPELREKVAQALACFTE